MTAPTYTPLVEKVAVAMWDTWNRVMVEYGLHKQSNGGFYDPEPTDDRIKAEAHRLLRKSALDEAKAALDVCEAEAMREALRMAVTCIKAVPIQIDPSRYPGPLIKEIEALLSRLDKPTGQPA